MHGGTENVPQPDASLCLNIIPHITNILLEHFVIMKEEHKCAIMKGPKLNMYRFFLSFDY